MSGTRHGHELISHNRKACIIAIAVTCRIYRRANSERWLSAVKRFESSSFPKFQGPIKFSALYSSLLTCPRQWYQSPCYPRSQFRRVERSGSRRHWLFCFRCRRSVAEHAVRSNSVIFMLPPLGQHFVSSSISKSSWFNTSSRISARILRTACRPQVRSVPERAGPRLLLTFR